MKTVRLDGGVYRIDGAGDVWVDMQMRVTDPALVERVRAASDGAGAVTCPEDQPGAQRPPRARPEAPAGPRWIDERSMAARLGVSQSWLQKDRLKAHPAISFERFGKSIRYRVDG